jgi:hypothetical protein
MAAVRWILFGFAWIGAYFVIPILRGWWPDIVQPSIPPEAWVAIGGVLGVASFSAQDAK